MVGREPIRSIEAAPGYPDGYYDNPERQETDNRNQLIFSKTIERLTSKAVDLLPDLGEEVNHRGGRSVAAKNRLEKMHAIALLSQDVEIEHEKSLAFTPQPFFRLGREDSRRQVFFGEISGLRTLSSGSSNTEVAVGVIPREDDFIKHEQAIHEVAMYQHLAAMDIPTLDVIGVVKSSSPDVYGFAITHYEPTIRTLDTLNWADMSDKYIAGTLNQAVDTLALLHVNYVFHGDSEFKNIAVCDARQKPVIVDLELSGSLRDKKTDISKLSLYMSSDFSSLATSIDRSLGRLYRDEPGSASGSDRFYFLDQYIFTPYHDSLVQLGVVPGDPLWLAFDAVVRKKLDEAVSSS